MHSARQRPRRLHRASGQHAREYHRYLVQRWSVPARLRAVGEVVRSQAGRRVAVELDSGVDVEARAVGTEVEAINAREEADGWQFAHGHKVPRRRASLVVTIEPYGSGPNVGRSRLWCPAKQLGRSNSAALGLHPSLDARAERQDRPRNAPGVSSGPSDRAPVRRPRQWPLLGQACRPHRSSSRGPTTPTADRDPVQCSRPGRRCRASRTRRPPQRVR